MRGINRSDSNHLSITGLNGSGFDFDFACSGGLGEQSSNSAYFPAVCLDTPTSLAIRRQETPCASRILICRRTGVDTVMFLSSPGKTTTNQGI